MSSKPNILLLLPDQHRGDWLPYDEEIRHSLGMEPLPIRMPHVRKLMDRGVTFTRAITPSPLCAPARACLASGLRYHRCGVESNRQDYPLLQRTFYSVLKEQGYRVGGVGKFDLHKATHWWGLDGWIDDLGTLGFTDGIDNAGKIDAIVSGKETPKDPYMKYLHERGLAQLHVSDMTGRGHRTEPTGLPDDAYCDNWLTRNGLQLLERFPVGKPWFMAVNFTGPHNPWDVTAGMRESWQDVPFPPPKRSTLDPGQLTAIRQNYAAMLENIDRNIGLLLEEVERRGELENTLIVYSSDHGEMLGDFDLFGKVKPQRGSIHIPLVIAGPGIGHRTDTETLVELQDLARTFTDLAGAAMPEAADSVSLLPHLRGEAGGRRRHQISALGPIQPDARVWATVSDGRYKLTLVDGHKERLADLSQDPWETENVLPRFPGIAERLEIAFRIETASGAKGAQE